MALRLGDWVVSGEINNTQRYAVHGWLQLRQREPTLLLQLTGNCDPDLAGRRIRFKVRNRGASDDAVSGSDTSGPSEGDEPALPAMAWQQIGPTGTMTAARQVKVSDCSTEELLRRCQLGEPPPFEWKPCLYLEWFGQNGRTVVELVDPDIELVESVEWPEVPPGTAPPESPPEEDEDGPASGLSITSIRLDEDGEVEIRDETPAGTLSEEEDEDDPYGLMPDELQRQLDAQAFETDRALKDDGEKSDVIRELELMDELLESGPGELIGTLLDQSTPLPPAEQLDDEQVEQALKVLLAQLAVYGVALSLCEHFTPRAAYQLLVETICEEETAYPELRQTQWVQQFMTAEYCDACAAEMEREAEEYERRRKENPNDETPEEDIPY